MKKKPAKTLRSMIVLLYVFMTILNITLLTLIISDNQAEIMTENASYKGKEMLTSLSKKMKEFTSGLNATKTTNTVSEEEQFQAMDAVLTSVIKNYVICDENGGVVFQSREQTSIPEEFVENIQKALVNQEYSSAEYYMVTDSKSESIQFYYPMNNLGYKNRVLYAAYDLKGVRQKYEKLFNSIKIMVVLVIVFHLFMAFYINRLVVGPIFQLRDVTREIASGKYDVRLHLKRRDELGELAEGFNYMAGQIKIIEEQKKEEAKYNENRKYLDNINEGLLLIDQTYAISGQYSKFLEKIFRTKDIGGRNLVELLFPNAEKQQMERKELENFLNLLFTNQTSALEMINELNPVKDKPLNIPDPAGKEGDKIVKITFQRIFNDNVIENLMVLFEDKTNIYQKEQELERERVRKARDVETMTAILKLGPDIFRDFIDKTRQIISIDLDKLTWEDSEKSLTALAHELRDLKYLATLLEMAQMVETIMECEKNVSMVRSGGKPLFKYLLGKLPEQFNSITGGLTSIENSLLKITEFQRISMTSGFHKTRVLLDNFGESLKEMVDSVSHEQGKEIDFMPEIKVDDFPYLLTLRNPLMLLVRNTIDHGIEDTFERLSLLKNQKGKIVFKILKDEKSFFITVEDDGRGIDFDHIRKKALKNNILKEDHPMLNHPDIFNLVFQHRYSYRDPAAPFSAKGGELNLIMNEVKKLNGTFHVKTTRGKGTALQIILPLQ